MRILVVDDDHLGSRLLEFLLTEQGYSVTLAETPRAALAAIAKQPLHLILLDVNLPQVDGFEPLPQAARARRGGASYLCHG